MNSDSITNKPVAVAHDCPSEANIKKWQSKSADEPPALECPTASIFPEHSLPDAARYLIDEIVRTTFADRSLASVQAIPWMAAALGKGAVARHIRETFANLFVIAFAESGSGKSEVSRIWRRPFDGEATAIRRSWEVNDRPRIEANIRSIDKKLRMLEKPKKASFIEDELEQMETLIRQRDEFKAQLKLPTLLMEDATQEAMIRACASYDESMMSFSSDAGKVLSNLHGRYSQKGSGSALKEDTFYLKGFSCEQHNVDRVESSLILTQPCLTAMWLVQPGKIPLLFGDESLRDGGLIPRFMPYLAPSGLPQTSIQSPLQESLARGWASLISDLFKIRKRSGGVNGDRLILNVEEAAADELLHWENANRSKTRGGEFHDIASFVSRWKEWVLRIAVSLQTAKYVRDSSRDSICASTIREAMSVADWHINEQLRLLYTERQASRQRESEKRADDLNRLCKVLGEAGGSRSLNELNRRNNFSTEQIEQLAKYAPERLSIESRPSATKPSRVCVLRGDAV
jgi:hypothetical protein